MLNFKPRHSFLSGSVLLLFTLLASAPLRADIPVTSEDVGLGWDPQTDPSVAGYMVHYGTASRNYTASVDAGTSTSVVLPGLTPGVTYFAAVTAYNSSLRQSAFSNEVCFIINANPGALILLEPEQGTIEEPMYIGVEFAPGNTGFALGPTSTYVAPLEDNQQGTIMMTFDAPATADYFVWCRVKAPTSGSDSLFYSIDGGPEQIYHVYGDANPPQSSYSDNWTWTRIALPSGAPLQTNLSQGSHTLTFRNREAEIRLEAVALSSDPAFVPAGEMPREGDVVIITTRMNSGMVGEGDSLALSVTTVSTGTTEFQWYKDGVPIAGETDSILSISEFGKDDAGSYTVIASSGDATVTSETAVIDFVPAPQITSMEAFVIGTSRFVVFDVEGHLGSTMEVYASSDLRNWSLLDELPNDLGRIIVADPGVRVAPARYYKLLVP